MGAIFDRLSRRAGLSAIAGLSCYTYYTILSTLDYKFVFKYLQLWQSYAGLQSFPRWLLSRMVCFPESHFSDGHFPGWDNFLWLIYRHTLNMNNTIYKFIQRRKANWPTLLTPQGYAKCQMLIFHHSSKTNELYETSKVRLKLHLFPLSYPDLVL